LIQGKCPKCGQLYFGCALLEHDQICPECGVELLVTEDKRKLVIECSHSYIEMDKNKPPEKDDQK
jgi:acetyl-CoA carboxylase beta subunit